VDRYEQIAMVLASPLGRAGFVLFLATLFITCFGSTLEIVLALAYALAQGFGWNWSKNTKPGDEARFSLCYTLVILLAAIITFCGLDPLKLTVLSMALTAATLPIAITPFLLLMNDEHYVQDHGNRWFSNLVVITISILACILAIVTIPLEIFGS
jgi:Mn2+/Fe2+ NRAMP family transporter